MSSSALNLPAALLKNPAARKLAAKADRAAAKAGDAEAQLAAVEAQHSIVRRVSGQLVGAALVGAAVPHIPTVGPVGANTYGFGLGALGIGLGALVGSTDIVNAGSGAMAGAVYVGAACLSAGEGLAGMTFEEATKKPEEPAKELSE